MGYSVLFLRELYRNFGILIAFMIFFMIVYLLSAEYISSDVGKGEVLIFQRSHLSAVKEKRMTDEETGSPTTSEKSRLDEVNEPASSGITAQKSVFHWRDICYDITIKGRTRRITDHVNGWVKPGKLTALMVSIAV
jgi:hypothetical protein